MLKVETYKISHSLNLLFLSIVVILVALFLGVSTSQMGITTGENLTSVVFVSSSAVLMLYIVVLASMYINRDYASNNFRVLVGIGVSRSKIIFSKYLIFLLTSILIICLHALSAILIPCLVSGTRIAGSQFVDIVAYMTIYASIISIIFLLAIIGRTLIKSILLNIAFIILSSVSVVLLGSGTNFSFAFPIQLLQFIANNPNRQYVSVMLISFLYMIVTYGITHHIFMKQEL